MGGAAAAVGLIAGVGGSLLQAKAQTDAGNAQYQAGMMNARYDLLEGYQEEARRRREANQELSRESVAYAKAGVSLEGSPLDVLARNAMELERESLDARLAGIRGYNLESSQAKNQYRASRKAAMATLLSGGAQLASGGYRLFGGGPEPALSVASSSSSPGPWRSGYVFPRNS